MKLRSEDFRLPILQIMSDGKQRTRKQLAELAADRLGLSPEDRAATLMNSPGFIYKDRSSWAVKYLFAALLLEKVAYGQYVITQRGRDLLAEKPERISKSILMRYPEFVAFRFGSSMDKPEEDGTLQLAAIADDLESLTPLEQMQRAYDLYQGKVTSDLLDRMAAMNPTAFEKLVLSLLLKMGYGGLREEAGQAIGGPGDGGVDGVIKEDRLGLDLIYLQAKRWQGTIGREEVQKFVGSLTGKHAHKGVFITTSSFASTALDYVRFLPNTKVVLIDGQQLAKLCIEFGIGVQSTATYVLRKVDSDFFEGDD